MKKLTKLLSLGMAALMSVSLFACTKKSKLNPVEGEIAQKVNGNQVYNVLTERVTPALAYDGKNYKSWKKEVRSKFIELFGLDNIKKNACDLDVKIESTEEIAQTQFMPEHTRVRFVFNSEYGSTVPCYLLIPHTGKESYPLAITLQGHADSGFASSVGITDSDDPEAYANERGAFAIQAIEQGYIALAIEQRGMGERKAKQDAGANIQVDKDGNVTYDDVCDFSAYNALLLGRTLLGERIWDVSKAIDALGDSTLADVTSKINMKDITITGNSGGGTVSYYAACYDERITTSAPSCAFCSYEDSLLWSSGHCACNFVPHAYEWFDMQDLACLIAPRKLVIVNGSADKGFPESGARRGFETVQKIYAKAGAEDNCSFTITNMGHYWVEDSVWSSIAAMNNK